MNIAGINEELVMDLVKIFIAMLCGGIIGFERELKDKPAGLRTNILVSTGSCLFVIFALKAADSNDSEAGRIIGPIITGIGFLGAGTIIQARGSVKGLTSAATIWVVAGLGMCAGMELFYLAVTLSLLVLFILFILGRVEGAISHFGFKDFEIVVFSKPSTDVIQGIRHLMEDMHIDYRKLQAIKEKDLNKITFTGYGGQKDLTRLISNILGMQDVVEARLERT